MFSMDSFPAWWIKFSFCSFYLNGTNSARCTEEGKWCPELPVCARESVGPRCGGGDQLVCLGLFWFQDPKSHAWKPSSFIPTWWLVTLVGNIHPDYIFLWKRRQALWNDRREAFYSWTHFVSSTWWLQGSLGLLIPTLPQRLGRGLGMCGIGLSGTATIWLEELLHRTPPSHSGTSFIHPSIHSFMYSVDIYWGHNMHYILFSAPRPLS